MNGKKIKSDIYYFLCEILHPLIELEVQATER